MAVRRVRLRAMEKNRADSRESARPQVDGYVTVSVGDRRQSVYLAVAVERVIAAVALAMLRCAAVYRGEKVVDRRVRRARNLVGGILEFRRERPGRFDPSARD